jgi:hypothetical protein
MRRRSTRARVLRWPIDKQMSGHKSGNGGGIYTLLCRGLMPNLSLSLSLWERLFKTIWNVERVKQKSNKNRKVWMRFSSSSSAAAQGKTRIPKSVVWSTLCDTKRWAASTIAFSFIEK